MSIDRTELHDAAQKAFLADRLLPPRDESWALISEMGWLLLPLPEEAGGLGLGRDASAAIHFELGKVLCGAPLLPALLVIQALAGAEDLADRGEWLERVTAGELVTLGLLPAEVTVEPSGSLWLSGTLAAVADADMVGHVLVCAKGLTALVPLDAETVTVTETTTWDESRRLFNVVLTNHAIMPELVLARGEAANAIAQRLEGELQLALAADCLGGASAALAMTVEYLKTRKQFERPLAMFQALKHRCADLQTQIVAAEALLWKRAVDAEASLIDLGALKALASDLYRAVAEEAIQLHGGIGLTDEHACHRFMKRAMLNLQLGGSLDIWRERAGRQALDALAG